MVKIQSEFGYREISRYCEKFSNPQPSISVLEKWQNFLSRIADKDQELESAIDSFLIGVGSKGTANMRRSTVRGFNEYLRTQQKEPEEKPQEFLKEKTEDPEITPEEIARKQEELRQAEELAKIQAEELAKTQKENLEKQRKLEEEKRIALELQAKKEAEEKRLAQEKRVSERYAGFVSMDIPETFVPFNIEENIPEKAQKYFEQKGEKGLFYDLLNMGKHVVLVGQAGTGKTELSLLYAYDTQTPVFKYSCSADARKNDLIGSKTIDSEQMVKIVCGMITKAVLAGNKFGKAMLILDEGNALIPKVQILLQGLTDGTGFIDLPEAKLKINKGVKFNVVITMNDQYSGTNPLNKPIRNRFEYIEMDRLRTETKMKIFAKYNVSDQIKNKLCKLDDKLDDLQKQMKLSDEESLSVRSMNSILEKIEEFEYLQRPNAIQTALETGFKTKFSDKEDRETIQKEIDLIFN